MNLSLAIDVHKPALLLTRIISRTWMHRLRVLFFLCWVVLASIFYASVYFAIPSLSLVYAGIFIFLALWIEQMMLYSYHNYFYFLGFNSVIGLTDKKDTGVTYEVADIVLKNRTDVTAAFVSSPLGEEILLRSGLEKEAIATYVSSERRKIHDVTIEITEHEIFTIVRLGNYLLRHDKSFEQFLHDAGIQQDAFTGALHWVASRIHQEKRKKRWWSKDQLSKVSGLGREWSYGRTYQLEQFAKNIRTSAVFSTPLMHSAYAEEKVSEIESILAREKSSNVLLIGDPGVGKIDLLITIERRMEMGTALNAISGQHITILDTDKLFTTYETKQDFEFGFVSLLTEATRAGNTIIVFENISTFIAQAKSIDVYIPELLDTFLATPQLHIIATDTPGAYHTHLETKGAFVRHFQEVLIEAPDLGTTIRVLQDLVYEYEHKHKLLFTYSALEAVASSADRFIVTGVMPEKAVNLLVDIVEAAIAQEVQYVTDAFVYQTVSEKTGIPAGPIGTQERDVLLNLENILHKRVIGQNKAVDAIARTMRRARAGVQTSERPIGTFLFLGPTGVGKTETAKALAYVFFKDETNISRIDMSEFNGADAVARLIGDEAHSGVLSDMLNEHPYCVLLLDEFEKASPEVHDLFLQILDEGMFTDGRGAKINARNTIIIATSNAGSALIMKTVQQRKDINVLNEEIINHIVSTGIFKPELINRFDSTVIFEPLDYQEQGEVAQLMLADLHKRIQEKGYTLEISKELIDVLIEKGYSPEFGARPMQRVLQDIVEEKVAQEIIKGTVQKGGIITLTRADFETSV